MPAGRSKYAAAVEAVDIQARSLYQRTCEAGSRCDDVAIAVRSLHAALGDLLLEADDPKSLINAPATEDGPNIFPSQLKHVLEDCEYTLWQVRNTVDKHYTQRSFTTREEDAIGLARFKIASQVSNVAFFLDTVREPTFADMAHPFPQPEQPYEDIDDVNPVLAQMRIGAVQLVSDSEFIAAYCSGAVSRQELCRSLHRELVRSNAFNSELIVAALPRLVSEKLPELDFESYVNGTNPFLKRAQSQRTPVPTVPPKIPINAPLPNAPRNTPRRASRNTAPHGIPTSDHFSPKELMPADLYNEKFDLSVKQNRPTVPPASQDMPYRPSPGPSPPQVQAHPQSQPEHSSAGPSTPQTERHARSPTTVVSQAAMGPSGSVSVPSSSSDSSTPEASTPSTGSDNDSEVSFNDDFALMSTRDLLDFDLREQERFAARVGVAYLYPQLRPGPTRPALPAPSNAAAAGSSYGLSTSTALTHPSSSADASLQVVPPSASDSTPSSSASPRYVPPLLSPPPPYDSASEQEQQQQRHSSIGAFGIVAPAGANPPNVNPQYMLSLGLAPDSHGNLIPPDAIWTRINRRLVSPEVLERAGVRYEARPNFVAILGKVNRSQITEFAKQSAEARRVRKARYEARRNPTYDAAGASNNNTGPRARRTQPITVDAKTGSVAGSPTFGDPGASPQGKSYAFAQSGRRRSFDRSRYVQGATQEEGGKDVAGRRVYPFIVSPPSSATDVNNSSEDSAQSPRPRSILKNKNTNKLRYKDGKIIEVSPEGLMSDLGKKSSRDHHARDKSRHRDRDSDRRRDRDRDQSRDRTDKDRSRHHDKDRSHDHESDYDRDKPRDRSRRREERSRTHDSHKESDRDRRSERPERSERSERDRTRTRDHDWERERERDRDYNREKSYDYNGRDKDRDRKRRSYDDRTRDEKTSVAAVYNRSDRDRDRDRCSNQRSSHDHREHRNSWENRDGRDARDSHDGHDSRDRDGQKRREGTRLRDAIGAAGIGGAAASLLTVLSEAAQGL